MRVTGAGRPGALTTKSGQLAATEVIMSLCGPLAGDTVTVCVAEVERSGCIPKSKAAGTTIAGRPVTALMLLSRVPSSDVPIGGAGKDFTGYISAAS